jgi:hypothetical protein
MTQHPADSLSPEKLQLFVAGLSGLAPEEVRKAKVLYIRNAISEYHAMKISTAVFGQAMGCMGCMPMMWSMRSAQKQMIAAQLQLARERILNAIDVWRDDLKGEHFHLDDEEVRA